jgi:hypothetical protein
MSAMSRMDLSSVAGDARVLEAVRPSDIMQAYASSVAGILIRGDEAWRANRFLQRQMRRDADIAHAIMVREGAAAMMPGKVKPEDTDDLEHKARCDAIDRAIAAIPKVAQLRRHLCTAPWYGSAGAHMQYAILQDPIVGRAQRDTPETDENGEILEGEQAEAALSVAPIGFTILHGDSFRYDNDGNLVVLISNRSDRWDGFERVGTDYGQGVRLSEQQRRAFVVSTWNIQSPEPDWPESAERMYAGEGFRSILWDEWMRKQMLAQMGDSYIERFCRGTILVGHDGSAKGKAAAEAVVDALGVASAVTVNIANLADRTDLKSAVAVFEAQGTGNEIIMDAVQRAGEKIRLVILTQTLTTEAGSTGLGSGVAEAHESTFSNAIRYDVSVLDDAITRDLVWPLWEVNFPEDPRRPKYVSQILDDEEDAAVLIESAERLVRMGVPLSQRELRFKGGFSEPQGDEPVVGDVPIDGDSVEDQVGRLIAGGLA